MGGEGFDAKGLGSVVTAVEDVDAKLFGKGVAPVGAFPGEEGVDSCLGGGGDFGAGAAGRDADAAGGFGSAGADMDGPAGEGGVELGGEGLQRNFSFGDDADRVAFELEESAGGGEAEGAGDAGVIAKRGVDVEGQVGAVEGEAVVEAEADFFVEGAGDGLEAGPEEAVVDEEEVGAGGGGFADDGEGGVNSGGDPGDGDAGGVDLEAVQGGRVIGDFVDAEFVIENGYEIGEVHGLEEGARVRASDGYFCILRLSFLSRTSLPSSSSRMRVRAWRVWRLMWCSMPSTSRWTVSGSRPKLASKRVRTSWRWAMAWPMARP